MKSEQQIVAERTARKAAEAAQAEAAQAKAATAETTKSQEFAASKSAMDAEAIRIKAENSRVTAENASYGQAAEAAAQSSTTPTVPRVAGENPQAAARRRNLGIRTSILAGDSSLGAAKTTLG